MSKVIDGIKKDLAAIPKMAKEKTHRSDLKKQVLLNLPYLMVGYFCNKAAWLWRVSAGTDASEKMISALNGMENMFQNPIPSLYPRDILIGIAGGAVLRMVVYYKAKNAKKFRQGAEYGSARWGAFATVINDMVIDLNVDMASSEDKRLGTYFARKKELEAGRFSEKVLKYLWDDAFKMDKTAIFNENCKSLEDVVITYETATSDKLAAVLRMSVYEKMLSKMQQKNTDNNEN